MIHLCDVLKVCLIIGLGIVLKMRMEFLRLHFIKTLPSLAKLFTVASAADLPWGHLNLLMISLQDQGLIKPLYWNMQLYHNKLGNDSHETDM